jgi:hypothetical protein
MLLGFPEVSSGEGLNLFGKDENDNEINLRCVGNVTGVNYWNINPKEKIILQYNGNQQWEKYEITKYEERFIEGSFLDDGNWRHTISINRYSGAMKLQRSCHYEDMKKSGMCKEKIKIKNQYELRDCKVIERKF